MLLRETGEGVIAIGQASHAWLSGQLARAWGNDRFGTVEPFEPVCLAAEQHDVGMSLWDIEPTLNPASGRPHSFMEMPLATHLELWSAAPRRLVTQSRYAALLVSAHGTTLYERRNLDALTRGQAAAVRRFLTAQRALRHELIEQIRSDPAQAVSTIEAVIDRNRRLLFAWDHISLALCLEWAPTTVPAVPSVDGPVEISLALAGDGALSLDPWPFASDRVALECEGVLVRGTWQSETAMRRALAEAPLLRLSFELLCPSPGPASSA